MEQAGHLVDLKTGRRVLYSRKKKLVQMKGCSMPVLLHNVGEAGKNALKIYYLKEDYVSTY